MNIKNKKGFILLIIIYLLIGVLLILGVAFFYRSLSENIFSARDKYSVQALTIAEGGLNRALYDLRKDFVNDNTNPSWADGDINGIACGPDNNNFYQLYGSTALGNGGYKVDLKNVENQGDEIWIKATGTIGDINKVIQTYIKIIDIFPWSNVVFAGAGASGTVINGNVDIRGSVHILGLGLNDNDSAIDMSGGGNIGNNYAGIPSELKDKIPPCPTKTFQGETIESLEAELRIKQGLAALSGTAAVGQPNVSGNIYKETVDGVYISDGYGGNQGQNNVYSDNGPGNVYDLGENIEFPSLSDPYPGYTTYQDYLKANALVISDPAQLNQIANMNPNSNFSYSNSNGSISMDGSGNLTINGIVYIDNGGELNMNKIGNNKTINYSGEGCIMVTGDVGINVNLLTIGNNSFPNNIVGIMTPNDIDFNAADIKVMGLFYAEDEIKVQKQTSIAGALISNYFNMGANVPSVYKVPAVQDNLPDGIIGRDHIWFIKIIGWKKL